MTSRRRNRRVRRTHNLVGRYSRALVGMESLENRELLTVVAVNDVTRWEGAQTAPITGQITDNFDLALNSVTADGTTLTVKYTVGPNEATTPFRIGLYSSSDRQFGGDSLLSSITISAAADLTAGTHTNTYTIGSGAGQLALPGAGITEGNSDYYLLGVLDDQNSVAESETDPFNNDNTAVLTGAYRGSDGTLLVQSDTGDDTVSLTASTLSLTIPGQGTKSYSLSGVTGVRIRTHDGNDTISMAADIAPVAFALGGTGNDTLTTAAAKVTFDGGSGSNTTTVNGTSGDDVFGITASSVTVNGVPVSIANSSTVINGLAGNDAFTVSGAVGNVSINGGDNNDAASFHADASLDGSLTDDGSDQINVVSDGDITLTDTRVTTSDGLDLPLHGITQATLRSNGTTTARTIDASGFSGSATIYAVQGNSARTLKGGTGNDIFILDGYAGSGSITGGGGNDQLFMTNLSYITLTDSKVTGSGGLSMSLSGIRVANLDGSAFTSLFDLSGWSGTGTITGNGDDDIDTVVLKKNANFTLTNTQVTATDGIDMTLSGVRRVTLTGGASNNTFDVSGWTGIGSITGGGGSDQIIAFKDNNISVISNVLTAKDGLNLVLSGITQASLLANATTTASIIDASGFSGSTTIYAQGSAGLVLKGGTGADSFILTDYTGTGSITGGGGSDQLTVFSDSNITLSDTRITASNGLSLVLSGITQASLRANATTTARTIDTSAFSGNTTISAQGAAGLTLKGGTGADSFILTGYTGTGSITGGGGSDQITLFTDSDITLGDTRITASDGLNLVLSGITQVTLSTNATTTARTIDASAFSGKTTISAQGTAGLTLKGGTGDDSFILTGYTGTGSITGGGGSDQITVVSDGNITLTNTRVTTSGGLDLVLNGITQAILSTNATTSARTIDASAFSGSTTMSAQGAAGLTLKGGMGADSFILDGYTGTGSITGGGSDQITVVSDGNITLTNTRVTTSDGLDLALNGITQAILSTNATTSARIIDASAFSGSTTMSAQGAAGLTLKGGTGADSFMLDGYHGKGSITGGGGSDKFGITKYGYVTLTNDRFTAPDGTDLILSGIRQANLIGDASENKFYISGWSGSGSITGGGGSDKVVLVKDANFTLTDSRVTATDGTDMILSGIGQVNLTGGASNNTFNINGWTGLGALTGGGGSDNFVITRNASFTLNDRQLYASDGTYMDLFNVGQANLAGGVSNNNFDISGWSGTGSITGGDGRDKIIVHKDIEITLSDTKVSAWTGLNMVLSGITQAELTCVGSNNIFNLTGWTGTGSITGSGVDNQLNLTHDGNFTLTNSLVQVSGGLSMSLSGITQANLTGGPSDNVFKLTGWTGTGSITGGGGTDDKVILTDDGNFSLTNSLVKVSGGLSMILSGISQANLTGVGSNNVFNLTGWTGIGSITGSGVGDQINLTHDGHFTLTNSLVKVSGGLSMILSGISQANLTGGPSDNVFRVTDWTGTGSITGGGGTDDKVILTDDGNFSLTNSLVKVSGGPTMTLSGIIQANLIGGASNDVFDISGWSGFGAITGGDGSDKVVLTRDTNVTLTDSRLTATGGTDMILSGVEQANLTGGASNNVFDISGWSSYGSITGGGGSDKVVLTKDANFTLTDDRVIATGGTNMILSSVEQANLTGGASNNIFDISGWSSYGSITGGNGSDKVVLTKNANFTLNDGRVTATGGTDMILSGVEQANLTGGASNNTFDISGWTGIGALTGGGGSDQASLTKDADMTLSNSQLSATGGPKMILSGISRAALTLTNNSVARTADASTFTGTVKLTASGAAKARLLGGSGNDTLSVTGSGGAILEGGAGADTLSATGIGRVVLIGGAGADTMQGNGRDLQISGSTTYDSNAAALDLILAEWASASSYSERINHLLNGGGLNGSIRLTNATVVNDLTLNTLSNPSAGTGDWFVVNANDTVTKKPAEVKIVFPR